MVDHLPGKIKSSRIETRMLEGHKFSKTSIETSETLLIHLSDLHSRKIMWRGIVNIKLKMKSIS